LAVNTGVIGIGTVLSKSLSFLVIPICTFLLSPVDFGRFDLAVTYLGLMVPLVTLQLEQAIFRFVFDNRQSGAPYFAVAITLVGGISLLMGAGVFLVSHFVFRLSFGLPLAIYLVGFSLYSCCLEYLRGLGRLVEYSATGVVAGLSVFAGVLVLVVWLRQGVVGLMWAFAIPYVMLCALIVIKFRPLTRDAIFARRPWAELGSMLGYSVPLVPNVMAFWVLNVSDRTFVTVFVGAAANGIYAVAAKVGMLLVIVFGIFNVSFQQTAIESLQDSDRDEFFGRLFVRMVRVLLAIGCGVVGFSPFLFHHFVGPGYEGAIRYVPGLAFGAVLLILAQYLGNVLIAHKKTKAIGVSTGLGAVVNVLCNLSLIPIVGIAGAVISTIVGFAVMLVARYYIAGRGFIHRGDIVALVPAIGGYVACSAVAIWGGARLDLWSAGMAGIAATLLLKRELVRLISLVGRSYK
ncbi:MAG: polysaccharide biosynthesis C-terminal domain-containing protein, partial [Flavobacteriales bacterium]